MTSSRTPPIADATSEGDTRPEEAPADAIEDELTPTEALQTIGPYVVAGQLGFGGMCQVYLARDPGGREVALKVLAFPEREGVEEKRFAREGSLLQSLDHPNIVRVVGQGVDTASGQAYLALELVPGRDLRAILSDCPGNKLSPDEGVFVIEKIARALSAVHAVGIIHRDIKPGNVLVTPEGHVKVTDFGIAMAQGATRLTNPREVVGTAQYLAPETLTGDEFSPAVDLYALGSLAFRMLAGRELYERDSVLQIANAHVEEPAPKLAEVDPTLPAEVCQLIDELLCKDPQGRPTAEQVVERVSGLLPHTTQMARLWRDAAEAERLRNTSGRLRLVQALQEDQLIDDYRIIREIARGGMGVVYEAEHQRLRKRVALKVLLAGAFATEEERARFLKEAEAAASLEHPGIVPIFDAGTHDGNSYIAMDFVDGVPLSRFLRAYEGGHKPLLRLFNRVCDAVEHAHQQGVVHRDLKPDNVLVEPDGTPHILDFGIAKRLTRDDEHAQTALTADGAILGTLKYMPPEQAAGRVREVDERSDVYALGVILYEILTGTTPFTGSPQEILLQIPRDEPLPPSTRNPVVTWELDAICLKALEKEKSERYSSARELQLDVTRYLEREPITARRATTGYRVRKWLGRNRRTAVAAGSLALLLAVLSGAWAYQITLRRRARIDKIVAGIADGVARFEAREYSLATKCFDRAARELRPGEAVPLPPELVAALPQGLEDDGALNQHELEAWGAQADERRRFEIVNDLLAGARAHLEAGRLHAAAESLLKAGLASPEDPQVLELRALGVERLVAEGLRLLQGVQTGGLTELESRASFLEAARELLELARRLEENNAHVQQAFQRLAQSEQSLEVDRGRLKSLEEERLRAAQAEKHIRVTVKPSSGLPANGEATAELSLVVRDEQGAPRSGQSVYVRASHEAATVTQPEPTGPEGVATATVASTVAGVVTLTVTVSPGDDEIVLLQQPTVEFVPGPLHGEACSLSKPSTAAVADGQARARVRAVVADLHGNPIAGQRVEFAVVSGGAQLVAPTAVTGQDGLAVGELSSTVAGVTTVSATIAPGAEAEVLDPVPVTFVPGPIDVEASIVSLSQSSGVVADGRTPVEIVARVTDRHGNPVAGRAVKVSISGDGNQLSQPSGPTRADGSIRIELRSTVAGIKTITCTVDPGSAQVVLAAQPTVELVAGPLDRGASKLELGAQRATVADGVAQALVVIRLSDAQGNPIAGRPVELELVEEDEATHLAQPEGPTGADGVAVARLSSTRAGERRVRCVVSPGSRALTLAQELRVPFAPGHVSAERSRVTASPVAGVVADGKQAVQIEVVLADAHGNAIPARTVAVAVSGNGNTVSQATAETDGAGRLKAELRSTVAEAKSVTATVGAGDDAIVLQAPGRVVFLAGPLAPKACRVTARVGAVPPAADGRVTVPIDVALRDAFGNPVSGVRVELAAEGGGTALTQPAKPSDERGIVVGGVSATAAGLKRIQALVYAGEGAVALPTPVEVTFVEP